MKLKDPSRKELEYYAAMRTLIGGVTGANFSVVQRDARLTLRAVRSFMQGDAQCTTKTVDAIAWFIWRKMNASVLLCEDDLRGVVPIVTNGIWASE